MGKAFKIHIDFIADWLTQDRKKSAMVSKQAKATFLHVFDIFEDLGPVDAREHLPRTRTKHLFDGIWEIRVGQFRIAYFWHTSTCVLLHGIKKKRDKWSRNEKAIAKRNKRFYQSELRKLQEKGKRKAS